jgi:hypothetical protein
MDTTTTGHQKEEIVMSRKFGLSTIVMATLLAMAGTANALNPQPLPPRRMPAPTVTYGHPSGLHRLNPQPLPPG